MKNVINYYYHLNFEDIHQNDLYYKFTVGDSLYYFMLYRRNIEEVNDIYEVSNILINNNIYCHQIIPNINNQILTFVNGEAYILLKVFYSSDRKIKLDDIIYFSNKTLGIKNKSSLNRDDWKNLWSNKIDYFEYQVNKLGKKYPLIRDSFSYFVGIAENAICLLNEVNNYDMFSVSHQRIKKDYTIFELYNPLNFIIDVRIRDACEYFKSSFNENTFEQIKWYIYYNKLTINECLMFFSRMMFPTFYFDIYEDIINNGGDEKLLIPIIDNIPMYENTLKKLYLYLRSLFNMPDIEWLKTI